MPNSLILTFTKVIVGVLILIVNNSYAYMQPYWQIYGPAKIIDVKDTYPNLANSADFLSLTLKSQENVIICSEDKQEVNTIRKILHANANFKNIKFTFYDFPCLVDSVVQPIGIENAKDKTNKMLDFAYFEKRRQGLFFAVASFLTSPEVDEPRYHQFLNVRYYNKNKHSNFYLVSPGIYIVPELYDETIESLGMRSDYSGANNTIGNIIAKNFNSSPYNWQQFVTQAKMSSSDQLFQSVYPK